MFKINNQEWDLEFVDPHNKLLSNGDGYALGVTVPEWRTIFIANDIDDDLLYHVICHEIAHAECWSRGLIVPAYVEEVIADWIADNILEANDIANNVMLERSEI